MRIKDIIALSETNSRRKIGELLRFGIVGVIATIIQYGVYWLCLHFMQHNLAMTVGYAVSFAFNMFASMRYTFRVAQTPGRGVGFALSHVVNYFLQIATLNFFMHLGLSKTAAPIPMFAVCVPINFLLVRFFLKQNGISKFSILRLRREEYTAVFVFAMLLLLLHTLLLVRYAPQFTPLGGEYWHLFIRHFHLSGFDPITYSVISEWSAGYNVYRHPLLAFFMYPPYLINQALIQLTGINCAVFITAAILVFCALYSFVFLHRILCDVIGLRLFDARLLSFFFFSFAYVLLSAIAPDHFVLSLFMLLLTLYISGMQLRNGKKMTVVQAVWLFVITAGISLNNGLKVFIAALFVNRRRFFNPRFLLLGVLLPAALIWLFARFEYKQFVWEGEMARHELRVKRKAEQAKRRAEQEQKRQLELKNTQKKSDAQIKDVRNVEARQTVAQKMGTPMMKGEFMRWTDVSTERLPSVVENLFGESVQLHREHLLEDIFGSRPVIVRYQCAINYIAESLLVVLFLVGIWCGRRSRFMWMMLSFALLDWLLHVVLGFGLNEVYIMTAHWAYVIPLAIAYLFVRIQRGIVTLRTSVILLTLWLYAWNMSLLISFLSRCS